MPGFAWKYDDAFKKMDRHITAQSHRRSYGEPLIELQRHGWEEICNKKIISAHSDFMSDVLRSFPHGPPCLGSITTAVRMAELSCCFPLNVDEDTIVNAALKIEMLWRFVWNAYKRSGTSRCFALNKLKLINVINLICKNVL